MDIANLFLSMHAGEDPAILTRDAAIFDTLLSIARPEQREQEAFKALRDGGRAGHHDWAAGHDDWANGSRYELFAVINHRGTAHSGHYFAYIRDCLGEGTWTDRAEAETHSDAKQGTKDAAAAAPPAGPDPLATGKLKTPRGYCLDGDSRAGVVYRAVQEGGKAEAGGAKSLRTDQVLANIKVG